MDKLNILKALHKLQGVVTCVAQDGKADAGKKQYRYTTLPELLDELRKPMQEFGIVLHQKTETRHVNAEYGIIGTGAKWENGQKVDVPLYGTLCEVEVTSLVYHADSGEFLDSAMSVICNGMDVQALGSAVSYLRRYSLMTLLGIGSGDMADDGQAARGAPTGQAPAAPDTKALLTRLETIAAELKAPLPMGYKGWSRETIIKQAEHLKAHNDWLPISR